jgi:hypothetical protein
MDRFGRLTENSPALQRWDNDPFRHPSPLTDERTYLPSLAGLASSIVSKPSVKTLSYFQTEIALQ